MFLTSSISLDAVTLIASIVTVLLMWHKWMLGHWKRKGIEGPEPSLLFGNCKDLFTGRKTVGQVFKDIHSKYKAKGSRYVGCYFAGQPTYMPIDLELVKSVLQTDFSCFHSHGAYSNEKADPMSLNLFALDGPRWKEIRSKVSPALSPTKIKTMHQVVADCALVLEEILRECSSKSSIDIRDVMARYTMDVIGSCAFGLDVNCLRNPYAEFKYFGTKALAPSVSNILRFTAQWFLPHKFLDFIRYKTQATDVIDFFYKSVVSTIKTREQNNIIRKDFMNTMIQMKNSSKKEERLTVNEVVAQGFLFFAAGFETSSTTIHFAAYELAVNPKIQDRVREEIRRVLSKYNNEVTYEAVVEMEYLEQVIKETLRKYPPMAFLFRRCTESYTIPGETTTVDKGTTAIISALAIHYDPEYYPSPEKFDPERFTKENMKERPSFTWLPFGEGPRICLGLRFGIHEAKIGLLTLLKNYEIHLNERTITPLVYDRTSIVHSCVGGIWIDLEKIS